MKKIVNTVVGIKIALVSATILILGIYFSIYYRGSFFPVHSVDCSRTHYQFPKILTVIQTS